VLAVLLAAAVATLSPVCAPSHSADDPVGDVQRWPLATTDQVAEADITRAWVVDRGETLEVGIALAARPSVGEAYRYWVGFHIRHGGQWEYVDVRMHGDQHQQGRLVAGNAAGNAYLATLAAAWDGPELRFHVPKQVVLDAYGMSDTQWGSARASSDGPHPAPAVVMGLAPTDHAGAPEPQALVPCPLESPSDGVVARATPSPAAVALGGVLLAATLVRWRSLQHGLRQG
jgi:hypothetical protein